MHFTELAQWRIRAESGPYRTKGDVSQNSPGDGTRIPYQADAFLANPGWRHWLGNTSDTCYEWGDPSPHNEPSTNLRDAAFGYLVTGDTRYRDAVRGELLALAREPGLDFSNTTRWCTGSLRDGNPALEIGNWLSQLLVAYDYLGDESFSADQRATLDTWFRDAGHFFAAEVHASLDKNFVDRLSGDYRLTSYAHHMNGSTSTTSHYGGWDIYSLAKFYNNRRATAARFFGLVGIKLDDPELRSQAKRFVHEYLAYGTYPDGIVGDFDRWSTSFPDLGWDYAAAAWNGEWGLYPGLFFMYGNVEDVANPFY